MGYYSVVTGHITFNPPVTYGEVKDSGFVIAEAGQNYVDRDVMLESFGLGAEDNDLLYEIVASTEDSAKFYNIVEDLKQLVALLGSARDYAGYLHIVGEGDGSDEPDVWRLRVRRGIVEEVKPKLVWPED